MPVAQIPYPKVSFGKRKPRSQMVRIFMDDGKVKYFEYEVLRGCVIDKENSAYIIDNSNQYMGSDKEWYQVLSDRSCLPICSRNDSNIKDIVKLVDEIFAASYEVAKRQQFLDALKRSWQEKIYWLIGIPCSTMLLMYAIKVWKG